MDFEQNDNHVEPMPPSIPAVPPAAKPPKNRSGWKIFWGLFTGMSLLGNVILFFMLIVVVAAFTTGQKGAFTEEVMQQGPRTNKIVVITLKGFIGDEMAKGICKQIKIARKDQKVKGLIIRVNSPGGSVSSSDQIYNEIRKYRDRTQKPAVAFMQGVAASGGYYASVACEKIVAEPTVITGSIGVIMGHFVLQELLEDKLGIQPVIIKSGPKKDWPSSFRKITEEERQYLKTKVIVPTYKRFVEIVNDGRPSLTLDDVRRLSDGSIYGAAEALEEKLIDEIGYLDDSIKLTLSLAGIKNAQVVEYRKPFSLGSFLGSGSQSLLKIDRTTLYELTTPQVLYFWSIY